jgi:uncharacterized membrane protein
MAVVRAIYIPVSFFFQGNAAARILEHEATFRLAMLTDLTAAVLMVFVALALYRLLAPVNRARESHGHSRTRAHAALFRERTQRLCGAASPSRLSGARLWIASGWPTVRDLGVLHSVSASACLAISILPMYN